MILAIGLRAIDLWPVAHGGRISDRTLDELRSCWPDASPVSISPRGILWRM